MTGDGGKNGLDNLVPGGFLMYDVCERPPATEPVHRTVNSTNLVVSSEKDVKVSTRDNVT